LLADKAAQMKLPETLS